MRDLLSDALQRIARREGVDYADARTVEHEQESLLCKDDKVERHTRSQSRGHWVGAFVCPAMMVERWTFTGQSQ